ncbi:MAG: SBBP repeat-containing protein [Candidatus Kapabacteria bacterium]|nr:SBBP repeat-containing protein [Candidatus Kapabacteria bacterium]
MKKTITNILMLVLMIAGSAQLFAITGQNYVQLAPGIVDFQNRNFGFVENKGQWDANIKFVCKMSDMNIIVTEDGICYDYFLNLQNSDESADKIRTGQVIKLVSANVNKMTAIGKTALETVKNYFIGNETSKWATNVHEYNNVLLQNFYDKIDLNLRFDNKSPRYDFIVKPGADPTKIRMNYQGHDGIISNNNQIEFSLAFGSVKHDDIFAYQDINGERRKIECTFNYDGATVGFKLGNYNPELPLIIDPLVISSYYGGVGTDTIKQIVADKNNDLLIAGTTDSDELQTTPGVYQTTLKGNFDVFISKIRQKGTDNRIVYTTFFGGAANELSAGIGVDGENSVFIAGTTESSDIPVKSAFSQSLNGMKDGFIAKFDSNCTKLIYSTYFGGSKDDIVRGLAINYSGNAFICGETSSSKISNDANGVQKSLGGGIDGFIAEASVTGSSLAFATYLGGISEDRINAICLDQSENICAVGQTAGSDFPVFPNTSWPAPIKRSFDVTQNGKKDAVVLKLYADGTKLVFSAFCGGSEDDNGTAVCTDANDNVYFAGTTVKESKLTFPIVQPCYQIAHAGGPVDAFIGYCSSDGLKLNSMGFFGGSQAETITQIQRDSASGSFVMTGFTNSSNFPKIISDVSYLKGGNDIFIATLSANLGSLMFSTLIGGEGEDIPTSLLIDYRGDLYITGSTTSKKSFPKGALTFNSSFLGGQSDGFILKNVFGNLSVTQPANNEKYCAGADLTVIWTSDIQSSNDLYDIYIYKQSDSNNVSLIKKGVSGNSYVWSVPTNQPNAKNYKIMVAHSSGLISLTPTTFEILSAPKIVSFIASPDSLILCEGEKIKFSLNATGDITSFDWKHNNVDIPGNHDSSYTIDKVTLADAGNYTVNLGGNCQPSAMTQALKLIVKPTTKVTEFAKDTSFIDGTPAIIRIKANGVNKKYTWFKNGSKLFGETDSVLKFTKISSADAGKYKCAIVGDCSTDTSGELNITITPATVFENGAANSHLQLILTDSKDNQGLYDAEIISEIICTINLKLYSVSGEFIESVYNGTVQTGKTKLQLDMNNYSNGVYWISAECGSNVIVKKALFIK